MKWTLLLLYKWTLLNCYYNIHTSCLSSQITGGVSKRSADSELQVRSSPLGSVILPSSLTQNLTAEQQQLISRVQFNFFQKTTFFQVSSFTFKELKITHFIFNIIHDLIFSQHLLVLCLNIVMLDRKLKQKCLYVIFLCRINHWEMANWTAGFWVAVWETRASLVSKTKCW